MSDLLIGLLGALLATNQVTAVSNVVARHTGIALPVVDPQDPLEKEYQQLLAADDEAQTEIDGWILENNTAAGTNRELASLTLNARIEKRLEAVDKAYETFLERNPKHARARLAYGSFLNDTGRDGEAMEQWEKARELDPKNPASWNNLADYYSHRGPIARAFDYLAKAIELNPLEPVYHQNLATLVFMFRKDAIEYYGLADDQAVFRRALEIYRKALSLAPDNLSIATDLAQVYYYLTPPKLTDPRAAQAAARDLVDEGLLAWLDARKIAPTEPERQAVSIHLARLCLMHGRLDDARRHLEAVSDPDLLVLKQRISKNIEAKAAQPAAGTSAVVTRDPTPAAKDR